MLGDCVFVAALLVSSPALAAGTGPTITAAEGPGTLFSGVHAYRPAPGVALQQCDIVQTGDKGLVQLEFADGAKVEVGPNSRLLTGLPAPDAAVLGRQFLLSGWAKVTVPKRDKALPYKIDTPHFDLSLEAAVAVLQVTANGGRFFVESGSVNVLGGEKRVQVNAGSTYSRQAGQANITSGAAESLVKEMPVRYRDSLPPLLSRLGGRVVQPAPATEPNFKDVEAWQKADPDPRHCLETVMVRSAQESLVRVGFNVGPVDGVLGPLTREALRGFQQREGLAKSGELDAATLRALDASDRR